ASNCVQTDLFSRITYLQLRYDMSDLLLRDCDVMSMSHSIEVRLPFLDHRLVEFALSIPQESKITNGEFKVILRESMKDLIPEQIINREKHGFIFPLDLWLRGKLKVIIEDTLSESSVRNRGFFNPKVVKSICQSFFSGLKPFFIPWNLVVLELWCRQYIDKREN
ncbi:asparagine synthase C-terminal domain-containing protein, partial [bacterium]|nr:asparagine synthase C-terminal domain-containing protein [bacterium]